MSQDDSHSAPEFESKALIPRSGSSLAPRQQGGRIVAEMVSGALALSRNNAALVPSFIIGAQMFCEPDYRQILLWAEALVMEPAAVLERLLDDGTLFGRKGPWYKPELSLTTINQGKIVQLQWDIQRLPLTNFEWVDGLAIESIIFSVPEDRDRVERKLALTLPSLRRLECRWLGLRHLDLSLVPHLQVLDCSGNNLALLNLFAVSELRTLRCTGVELGGLDLSHVPRLQELDCGGNNLSTIDLRSVRQLTQLNCFHNQLTELDLSHTPELWSLVCDETRLDELDLAFIPKLTFLMCSNNQISTLDLSCTPSLQQVYCRGNPLPELNIWPIEELAVLDLDEKTTRLIKRPDQQF